MQGRYSVPGQLQNFNTEKGFKDLDKTAALKQVDTVSNFGVLIITCSSAAGARRLTLNILAKPAETAA